MKSTILSGDHSGSIGKQGASEALTEKVDRALTSFLGIPIFLGIMALVFFLTFTIGDWLKGVF